MKYLVIAFLLLPGCAFQNQDSCKMQCENCELVKIECSDSQNIEDGE